MYGASSSKLAAARGRRGASYADVIFAHAQSGGRTYICMYVRTTRTRHARPTYHNTPCVRL